MKKTSLLAVLFAVPCLIFGASFSTKNSGNWTTGSNWNGNSAPSVPLGNNSSVTISTGDSIFYGIAFDAANKLTINVEDNAILVLDQGIEANNNIVMNVSPLGRLVLNGDFTTWNNTSIVINGEAEVNGNISVNGNTTFTVNGSLDVDGNITASGNNNGADGTGTFNVTGTVIGNFTIDPALSYNTSTLPIELVYFSATQNSANSYTFEWETASEKDNEKFITQYSSDATNWKDLLETEGAGNTSVNISYRQDVELECYGEVAYFRLKQVDFTGDSSTSEIVAVSLLDQEPQPAEMFPNPVANQMLIDNHEKEIQSVYIFDSSLKLIDEISNVRSGKVKYSFGNKDEGIYYVGVKSEEGTDVQKVILSR